MQIQMKNLIFISLIVMMSSLSMNIVQKKPSKVKPNKTPKPLPANCLYGFQAPSLTNIMVPIRLNRNYDVECLSTDGTNCVGTDFKSGEDCRKFMTENLSKLKPLVCGAAHKQIYGNEGYGNPEHWCEKGRQWYFNNWHCSNETGLPVSVRLDSKTKNVVCLSRNGKECSKDAKLCRNVQKGTKLRFVPTQLACGQSNVQYFNNTNPYYDPKSNWCKSGNEYFFGESQWVCGGDGYGYNTPFRYNSLGDIECFSTDGLECAWGHGTGSECVQFVNENLKNLKPLVCGEMHGRVHGGDGYSNTNNWCRTFMDRFVLTTRAN